MFREEYYTEARIRGLIRKGNSRDHIKLKLAQEDIYVSDEEIQEQIDELGTDSKTLASECLRKKLRGRSIKDSAEFHKLFRFLQSKGHEVEDIRAVLNDSEQNI